MASTAPALREDRVVFSAGASEYTVRDVMDAAHFRGELDRSWRELLTRVAAETKARETEAVVEGGALDEAAVAFRYRYDLITAEETEAWLDARCLNLADFSEYFSREYWNQALGNRAHAPDVDFVAASPEQRELLAAELTLNGELDRMAARLTWRVAGRAAKAQEANPASLAAEREKFLTRHRIEPGASEDWLSGLSRDQSWLDEMIEFEALYGERREKLLTPETRAREVSSLRLPLTRLDLEMIEFESRNAANEALLCVRDDGLSMEEVAQEGRYPYRRTEMVLEEVPAELQQRFLSLSPGSVLEPTARQDGYVLSRLVGKHEPNVDDPMVSKRVEERILDRHFADLTSSRVQWRLLPSISEE